MKKTALIFTFLMALLGKTAFAQTPIGFDELNNWTYPSDNDVIVSNDGKYFIYDETFKSTKVKKNLVIKEIGSNREHLLQGKDLQAAVGFTNDSKLFIYRNGPRDSGKYGILNLATEKALELSDVTNIKIITESFNDLVIYQSRDGELTLHHLESNRKQTFSNVSEFIVAPGAKNIIIKSKSDRGKQKLQLLQIGKETADFIVEGGTYDSFVWNSKADEVAFLDRDTTKNTVLLYNTRAKFISSIFSDGDKRVNNSKQISSLEYFIGESNSLLINVKTIPIKPLENSLRAKVAVWSYFDRSLQPNKPKTPLVEKIQTEQWLVNTRNGKVYQQSEQEDIFQGSMGNRLYYFNSLTKTYSTISENGARQLLKNLPSSQLSLRAIDPAGNYLTYFWKRNWYSYNLRDQVSLCLTKDLDAVWYQRSELQTEVGNYLSVNQPMPISGTLFMIRDQNDVWILDASAKKKPVCLTSGYGKRNQIIFSNAKAKYGLDNIIIKGKLLLSAVGELDGRQGFFTCNINMSSVPEKLLYEDSKLSEIYSSGDSKVFYLCKEGSATAPNWYSTIDFKELKQVSDVQPWYSGMKSEMLVGKKINGRPVISVLYTPKDFNPAKKYPVIINYYQELSSEKNTFHEPGLVAGSINIPWFVSRGYLVLQPDINYSEGNPGKNALDCVNAAVDELVKIPYVDSVKLGINGQSFGAFETLYILTHSNRFKAALAGAPISDFISMYNTLSPHPLGKADTYANLIEDGQLRMRATLWEAPDRYLENSPVLNADKVSTPLLLRHCRGDNNVPFAQGMEFFLSLRRLGKPCWLLEYENGSHVVKGQEDLRDYTIRITQFYDYYLKGLPAPLWMIEGQKYQDVKYMPGYELDSLGRNPGAGINSLAEQKKIDAYSKIPLSEKLRPFVTKEKNVKN